MNKVYFKKMRSITFDYKNYKGETSKRRAQVCSIFYGCNQWHKSEQWLIEGYDLDKQEFRFFAMADMKNVKELKG